MITYEQALLRILECTPVLPATRMPLENLLDHYLAEAVTASRDLPHFDNSAVDGFGVRVSDVSAASEDTPQVLQFKGTIGAGDQGEGSLTEGCAIKILTGATVIDGVEAVVMKEFCKEKDGAIHVFRSATQGQNIRRRGEEYQSGQEVLRAGARVTPPVVGLLATLGHRSFSAHNLPKVVVLVTGNELVEPGKELAPGQIYNSNSYALFSALHQLGIEDVSLLHVQDTKESTREALESALIAGDVVISTGGVSVGDYDFVKDVAEEIGVNTQFWRIAIKPGKPVYFGTSDTSPRAKIVFGLPGNPVSALVTFHQLVRPALLKMMGAKECLPQRFTATLASALRKKSGRMEFVRGIVQTIAGQLVVQPTIGQESHMLGGLSQANCLIYFPLEDELLSAGTPVNIELLSWI